MFRQKLDPGIRKQIKNQNYGFLVNGSRERWINAKAAIKRASVLYSCLMHAIITRYMLTNSTLGVSAGSPHTSVSRMTVLRFSGLVLDTGN